jgi:DNA-binding transcriptional LysR family regulator
MRGFNLDHLHTFTEVIELGSFSAAADRMNLTQPAVSTQIRQLETRLGVRLIERVGKRATPTPAGAELLIQTRRINEAVAAALDGMAPHISGAIGRVRIGTGATACIHFLPPVLGELRRRFPALEVIVKTGNSSDILKQLEENAIDIGVVTLPAPGRMFEVTPLFRDEFVVLASQENAAQLASATPTLLARQPVVLYEPGAQTRRVVDDWFAKAGLHVKPVMELGSVEAIKELIRAGFGYGIVPGMAIHRRNADAGLVVKPLSPKLSRKIGLVLRRDKRLHRGLRETVKALRAASTAFSATAFAGIISG